MTPSAFGNDDCVPASYLISVIQHGPWDAEQLTDVLDSLTLSARGIPERQVAATVTHTSQAFRGRGWVRSVKQQAKRTLINLDWDQVAS